MTKSVHQTGHGGGHGHKHGMPGDKHHDQHMGASSKGHLSDAMGHLEGEAAADRHDGENIPKPSPKLNAGMPGAHGKGMEKD